MAENLSVTDELSGVYYMFLASTLESICASKCGKQATEQEELQVFSTIVVPMLGSGVYWEVNNGARTKTGMAY